MDLLEAKRQYGDLYKLDFTDGTTVVFRLLSWKEYEFYHSLYCQGSIDLHDESIFHSCIVSPITETDLDNLRAGVLHTITNIILSLSGPKSLEDWQFAIEDARKSFVSTLSSQVELMICRVFPAYKPEDIWSMDWPMIISRLAQAEHILLQTKQIDKALRFTKPDKNEFVENLVKDSKKITTLDRSNPPTQTIHRESNWSKVKD